MEAFYLSRIHLSCISDIPWLILPGIILTGIGGFALVITNIRVCVILLAVVTKGFNINLDLVDRNKINRRHQNHQGLINAFILIIRQMNNCPAEGMFSPATLVF